MRAFQAGKRLRFALSLLARGSSMTCTTGRLGLMIGTDQEGCPPGWIFIRQEDATVDMILDALEMLDHGRTRWPKAPITGKKNSEDALLDALFDSQDYIGS